MSDRDDQVVADGPSMTTPVHGVVMGGTGGIWQVRTDAGELHDVSLRGRLKHEAHGSLKLAVGDRVSLGRMAESDTWAIDQIHPRRSKLARRAPAGARGERVIVANLDQVLVVFAAARPEPHPRMLDRFLVIAEANGLAARIVINKIELAEASVVRARFDEFVKAGYPLHLVSAVTGEGLDALRAEVQNKDSALTGPSGVGKSSLMNRLFPGLDLRTAEISDSVNKGRHTTVGAVLHPLPGGGFVADTPGLREVGLWGIEARDIAHCFPEFRALVNACRFADCTHTVEPDCAIKAAIDRGEIGRGRYESYVKLREELATRS